MPCRPSVCCRRMPANRRPPSRRTSSKPHPLMVSASSMLHEQGRCLGIAFRDIVPVIQMVMGDDHRIHLQQGRHGQRQLDQGLRRWLLAMPSKPGSSPWGQHGVDEEAGSA